MYCMHDIVSSCYWYDVFDFENIHSVNVAIHLFVCLTHNTG